jgi:hypothetical protein
VRLLTPDRTERHFARAREREGKFCKSCLARTTLGAVRIRASEWSGYWPEAASLSHGIRAHALIGLFIKNSFATRDGATLLRENPSLLSQLGTALLSGRCFICLARICECETWISRGEFMNSRIHVQRGERIPPDVKLYTK